jgi:hypothetical protein
MPRNRLPVEQGVLPVVPVVYENCVFTRESFLATFGLRQSSLRREVREGRLKVFRRCGRYYLTGAEVMRWLRGDEADDRRRNDGETRP